MNASHHGDLEMVKFILKARNLENEIDVTATDDRQRTALWHEYSRDSIQIFKFIALYQ